MADSSQDRTLPATPRKIEKARAEGQVARSRDLGHFAALLAAALVLVGLAPWIVDVLARVLARGLRFDVNAVAEPRPMVDRLIDGGWTFAAAAVPMGVLMVLVALLAAALSGGFNFSWKAMRPQLQRIDPLSGLGRVFSMAQLGQALKACLLALVLGLIGAAFVYSAAPRFMHTLQLALAAAVPHAAGAVWAGVLLLLLALGAFAVVDVPFQRFMWMRQLRMSHAEVKQEHKEVEGNPEIKQRMRSRMREMSNQRMLAAVPKADLVVMNPTHFAVALRYDDKTMSAPRVVAKGADLMAMRIRDAAQAAQVPVLQAAPLARALYAHAEVDREIPAALFSAVAQVLAWVYQLRASMSGAAQAPGELPPLQVPPELDPLNKARALPDA
ncbi:MAG: flagellar biosynthesis protein FlhB [Rubrivivax sp.]|nr:flagellar biosynthesis protein FlhB [Rubrivivax sp.]